MVDLSRTDPRIFEKARDQMIEGLRRQNISDNVIDAMKHVPRHLFVPDCSLKRAYEDHPLSIGKDQTISAPHMVAIMCELLELNSGMNVLEIGTGSGYHAAIISKLIGDGHIFSIERFDSLAKKARFNLTKAGCRNVSVFVGDGTLGLPENAPFDRINVTCSAPKVPPPLLDQLKEGGRMVIPIGKIHQELYLVKRDGEIVMEKKMGVIFVPLVGEYGF